MLTNPKNLDRLIRRALREDVGPADVTTDAVVPENARCIARLTAKSSGVLSGMPAFKRVFEMLDTVIEGWIATPNGERFHPGDTLAHFEGRARPILTGERTALNFVQHLSGIATITAAYVQAVEGLPVRICDTRKTTPGLRNLEKVAVRHGGGYNHRHALFDGILIKENHIAAAGGIVCAVKRVTDATHHLQRIEIEVRDLDEFDQAVAASADIILLDNMSMDDMREAVRRAKMTRILTEASGNVTLDSVRSIAETGVDIISVGALTHSAPAADISLLIEHL